MYNKTDFSIFSQSNPEYENLIPLLDSNDIRLKLKRVDAVNRLKALTGIKTRNTDFETGKETMTFENHQCISNDSTYRVFVEEEIYAILVTSREGNKLEANSVACDMFGYSKEEFRNLTIMDLVFNEDVMVIASKMADLTAGKEVRSEKLFRRKDGKAILVEINAKTLSNGLNIVFIRELLAD